MMMKVVCGWRVKVRRECGEGMKWMGVLVWSDGGEVLKCVGVLVWSGDDWGRQISSR